MLVKVGELYQHRELLVTFVIRDIKVRYKQSLMGFLWAILMPLLIVSAGIAIRYVYAAVSGRPISQEDILVVAAKSAPWAFVVAATKSSCQSLIGNTSLVTKIYFPREVFPIATVLSQLADFLVSGVAVAVLLVVCGARASLALMWVLPLAGILVLLATGIALLVSAGSLFFRDVKYLVDVFVTFAIFFTPVFYDVNMLGRRARWLLLNPVAPILEGFSSTLRGAAPDLGWTIYSLAAALVMLVVGYSIFKKLESAFAEYI